MSNPRLSRAIFIAAFVLSAGEQAPASVLDIAGEFNVFVFQNFNGTSSAIDGRLAAGGDINLKSFSVNGSQVTDGDAIIAAGNLIAVNGELHKGNARYGGSRQTDGTFDVASGQWIQGGIEDGYFVDAQELLRARADYYGGLASTGNTAYASWGGIKLTGTDIGLNIFEIDGLALASASVVEMLVPSSSTVLINVRNGSGDTSYSMENKGLNFGGHSAGNILFNFYQATQLEISGIQVHGSILAPRAGVRFDNGQIDGTLVAQSVTGESGYYRHYAFAGVLPSPAAPVPEPGSLLLLGSGLAAAIIMKVRRRRL